MAGQQSIHEATRPGHPGRWAALSALGIVFGDLGTSPLYCLQTVVQATGGQFNPHSALGILSLIVWTLIVMISIKYCGLVMRADNHGEGGILALMSLVGANGFKPGFKLLTAMGLLGAALIYGDGVITPGHFGPERDRGSQRGDGVLQAVRHADGGGQFCWACSQRNASARKKSAARSARSCCYGSSSSPRSGRYRSPAIPEWSRRSTRAMQCTSCTHSGGAGFLVLGGVFLCITGGEALYADMGHFGRGPIRCSWYAVVLPSLLLSYAGQTAYLMDQRTVTGNPFFQIAPSWSIYPLVMLATVATIIASQAIITGSFSMTRQAMQLGWLPAVAIRQTSDRIYGQIYVPAVNWLLMAATIATTIAFGSSDAACRRLWHGGVDHHAADHGAAVPRHAPGMALAASPSRLRSPAFSSSSTGASFWRIY